MKAFNIGWVVVLMALLVITYQTSFDKRPDIYAYTKWAADSSGLFLGYLSLVIGWNLFLKSGGTMRKGLYWFNVGMFIMGSSFFFGPVINHYKILSSNAVEALHGVGMLGGMIGYLIALRWFTNLDMGQISGSKKYLLYALFFLMFVFLFTPTMFAKRAPGDTVKYWTELAGFGLSGAMLAMAIRSFRILGGQYRTALVWLLVSLVVMALSYPFGPIGQPNKLWTGAQGGTFHHGIMALSMLLFLITALRFNRLYRILTVPV